MFCQVCVFATIEKNREPPDSNEKLDFNEKKTPQPFDYFFLEKGRTKQPHHVLY